jgi:hypothetical protein
MSKHLDLTKANFNKYENYIRVGHNGTEVSTGVYACSDLEPFPTPSTLTRTLHDVDKDAYTDLRGYTHRNRVRHDVEDITLSYNVLGDEDEKYILNRISPAWIYVELTDKKTGDKSVHKMYASDKSWNANMVCEEYNTDSNGYIQYTDDDNNTYWYDSQSNTLYNSSYMAVPSTMLYKLNKVGNGKFHERSADFSFSLTEE